MFLQPVPISDITDLADPEAKNPEGLEAIASSGIAKQRGFVLVRAGGLFSQLLLLPLGTLRAGGEFTGFISAGLRLPS